MPRSRPTSPSPTPTREAEALAGELARDVASRPWLSQVASLLLWLVGTILAVLVCNLLVPGFHADPPAGPLFFALALGLLAILVQPLMVAGAVRIGWGGVIALAFAGQAVIVAMAAWLLPSVHVAGPLAAFLVGITLGVVVTAIGWLTTAGTNGALVSRLVARHRRHPTRIEDPARPGMVFVQLDGVPYPVLQMSLLAGTVPTLTRWVRSGSHVLHEWTPKLPATTPASQLGILHGVIDGIPAFRWYDRDRDKVIVTNRPADASLVESTLTTGSGLLADGGASIGNLFSGDAPESALTMSRRSAAHGATREAAAQFVSRPSGLTRALARSVSELLRDRFQARRAVRRNVQPRCHRSWTTALLRGVTNGMLRDVNTVLVAEHMLKGTRSIYVDYVDYDEVAHHAGVLRPESLEALESLDGVLRQLEQVAMVAPRRYRFIVLSDHGQAQGTPFADRYGEDLAEVVARLAQRGVTDSSGAVEGWARTEVLVDELATGPGFASRSLHNASDAIERHDPSAGERLVMQSGTPASGAETFHVFGSGNLGLIYVRGEQARLSRQRLDARFPRLVQGLAAHPGVGFIAVLDEELGPVAMGSAGLVALAADRVVGLDPLLPFGSHTREFLLRVLQRPEAPDIYVNSLVDPGTGEVAAFEGLVGCHGGLGGWQDRAFVMVPSDLEFPAEPIIGADTLHTALVDVLRQLGHREGFPEPAPPASFSQSPPHARQAPEAVKP